jgi:hypothetical protein
LVVTRKVAGTLDEVVARVPTTLERLVLRGPLAEVRSAPVRTWAANARLRLAGLRLARFARVEVEISEYSHRASLVSIRPVSPNSGRWGKRRFDRYFDLAHRVADQVSVQVAA